MLREGISARLLKRACEVQSCWKAVASSGPAHNSCSSGSHSVSMLVTLVRVSNRNPVVHPVGCMLCNSLDLGIYRCVSYRPTKTTSWRSWRASHCSSVGMPHFHVAFQQCLCWNFPLQINISSRSCRRGWFWGCFFEQASLSFNFCHITMFLWYCNRDFCTSVQSF